MVRRAVLSLVAVCVVVAGGSMARAQTLPADVVADHYELRFTLDFSNNRFTGDATLLVTVVQPTARITLNASGLAFRDASVVSGGTPQPAAVSIDERAETATFVVKRRLAIGPARIHVTYSAAMRTDLRGLYVGTVGNRKYAATQFEATYARRAFPSFDQPDMKASFSITAVVPSDVTAISNGRIIGDTPGPGNREHTLRFATTRKMSTYLVALAVGDFACVSDAPAATSSEALGGRPANRPAAPPVPIRACAIRGREQHARFALDAARALMPYYDGYFGTRYPFGKVDLVAIPDFDGGGMENAGAIFFGEPDLLVDETRAPLEAVKRVATTVAHELAHLWMGDLVTMKWWDDLWLKESFATWMETKALRTWKPEWDAELDEVAAAEDAMALDALASTHPVRARVTTPVEIEESYDAIVYQKGAAVVRMVEAAMGPDAFRAALNAYVKQFAYGNATAEDLYAVLMANTIRPVDRILRAFLDQPGVPSVAVAARCDTAATSVLTVSQRRFTVPAMQAGGGQPAWTIPIAVRTIAGPSDAGPAAPRVVSGLPTTYVLTDREQTFPMGGCQSLVLGNAAATGYFRSAFPPAEAAPLARAIGTALSAPERLRTLNDAWAFTRSGAWNVGQFLELARGFAGERRPPIVERLTDLLEQIDAIVVGEEDHAAFRSWIGALLAPLAASSVPAAQADDRARRIYADVVFALGSIAHDPAILATARQAVLAPDAGVSLDPELRGVYARLAAIDGDTAVFDRLVAAEERQPTADTSTFDALAAFTNPALVHRALEYALSPAVRAPEATALLSAALENRASREVAWAFLKTRWLDVMKKSGSTETITELLASVASFCDSRMREDAKAFFEGKGLAGSRALEQALDQIQGCVEFRTTQQPHLRRFLAAAR